MRTVSVLFTAAAIAVTASSSRAQTWQMPPDDQRCPSKWGAGDQRGSGNMMKPETVLRAARLIVRPMFRAFFGGIPEVPLLFDTRRMRRDAEAFDYSTIGPDVLEVSWAPSYCTAPS